MVPRPWIGQAEISRTPAWPLRRPSRPRPDQSRTPRRTHGASGSPRTAARARRRDSAPSALRAQQARQANRRGTWGPAPTKARLVRRVRSTEDDVHEDEQEQPHHVDEVPVPGGGFEAEVLLRRHLTDLQAQQADSQEDGADRDVEAVEARRHEEDRTVQLGLGRVFAEEQVAVQDVVILIGLNAGEQQAQQDGDQQAHLGGLAVAGDDGVVRPGQGRARQQQDDRVHERQAPRIQQFDARRGPGLPGGGGVHPVADLRDDRTRFIEDRHVEEHPEEGDEEHHFRSDEQHHAVTQADAHDGGVVALAAFLHDIRPPREHGEQDAGQADEEHPLGAGFEAEQPLHPHDGADEHDAGGEGADQRPRAGPPLSGFANSRVVRSRLLEALRREEGVAERDLTDALDLGVGRQFRGHKVLDREGTGLSRPDFLTFEAETLQFLEIRPRPLGHDIIGRRGVQGLVRGVGHLEIGHAGLADPHLLAQRFGAEGHRQVAHIGVEPNQHLLIQDLRRGRLGPLHRAVEARHLTEDSIEGHRREGRAGHRQHQSRAQNRDLVLLGHGWAASIATGASGWTGGGRAGSARSSVARASASAALRASLLALIRDRVTR
uniref:LigA n=1 Tax=Parastrongyloides trichosuri TaxID=131310 RepID=A0A0N5A106_PARTI